MLYKLISWVKTSSVHSYPVTHFTGSREECEARRAQSNFPAAMQIIPVERINPT